MWHSICKYVRYPQIRIPLSQKKTNSKDSCNIYSPFEFVNFLSAYRE